MYLHQYWTGGWNGKVGERYNTNPCSCRKRQALSISKHQVSGQVWKLHADSVSWTWLFGKQHGDRGTYVCEPYMLGTIFGDILHMHLIYVLVAIINRGVWITMLLSNWKLHLFVGSLYSYLEWLWFGNLCISEVKAALCWSVKWVVYACSSLQRSNHKEFSRPEAKDFPSPTIQRTPENDFEVIPNH